MSPDGVGLAPSPYHAAERSAPCGPDDAGFADFRHPPPTGPPPPPGPYDQQWGHGWESWDEGVDTPNNMDAAMPRFAADCWGPTESCEPAWSPMQQMHQGQ